MLPHLRSTSSNRLDRRDQAFQILGRDKAMIAVLDQREGDAVARQVLDSSIAWLQGTSGSCIPCRM